jgi:hypothetical protein
MEAFPRHWYINAPRGRWLISSPSWVRTDQVAYYFQLSHRILFAVALAAWVGFLWLAIGGQLAS